MKNINKVITEFSDDQLYQAVAEVIDWGIDGVLVDGLVRDAARKIASEFDIAYTTTLVIAKYSVLETAAIKWFSEYTPTNNRRDHLEE